jgi:hypothetical protein
LSVAWKCRISVPPFAIVQQAIGAYEEAGLDEGYLGQVGGQLEGAFEFFATQVLPQVRAT